MKIDKKLIKELKDYLEEFDLSEIEYQDGNKKVKVAKNKLAPPFQKVEFDILYGQGISYEGDLIEKAVEAGAIIQSGSWFSYKEDKIAQGKENLRQKLKEDAKLKKAIQKDVMGYLGL